MEGGNCGNTCASLSLAATWTREQDKLFETGLVIYPEGTQDRFARIAERVPAGRIELPNYLDDYDIGPSCKREKKKGIPWTQQEHRLYIISI
ncbi:hypothetical protein MKX01_009842 [Papaver californicum]|nr:hypothetical protein MKX01_009842 [Papaver californicum]